MRVTHGIHNLSQRVVQLIYVKNYPPQLFFFLSTCSPRNPKLATDTSELEGRAEIIQYDVSIFHIGKSKQSPAFASVT